MQRARERERERGRLREAAVLGSETSRVCNIELIGPPVRRAYHDKLFFFLFKSTDIAHGDEYSPTS